MANQKIGVQAVWDNANFNRGQDEYITKLSKASGVTKSTASAMGSGAGGLSMVAVGVGTILGNLAAGAIRNVINGFSQMSSAVIENLGSLQKLEIGLTMLEAREMTQAGLADNIGEAMDGASLRASAMLEVLKDVSLASPFQYQDIAKVLQLNMAFGQSSKMAMALTQAMTDMAAVSPMASPELLERIAYNFSQMSLTGKITARDMRDLALAGVNLNQILVEQLGGGMDVINEKLKDGELTMRDVSQAFIDYAERNFAGAARSMATKTIPGLMSSFKDLAVFASKDLFGPAGEVVTKFLEKIYYAAKKLLDSGVLQKIGIWLKVLAETATNFLSKLFGLEEVAEETAASTAANLTATIENTVSDTIAIAEEEAQEAVASFNKIGLDTAVAWLEGFSSADYSVLSSIQSYLSTLSSNLADQLGMEGYEAQQLFANLFASVTESISTGNLEGAFNTIINQFGSAGEKVVELAKANLELAKSEDVLTAAQKKLTAAQKAQEAAMSKIDKLTWEYNEALRKGASPETLKAKFNQINAAYDEYEASNKAIEAAEEEVDVAKEQKQAAQDQQESLQDLVNILMQFANAQKVASDATQSAIEDMEEEYTQLAEITEQDIFAPSMENMFDTQKLAEYEEEVRKHFTKINEWIDNMPSLSDIFKPPGGYETWGAWWDAEMAGLSLPEKMRVIWDLVWDEVNKSFNEYKDEEWPKSWDEYWEDIKRKAAIMTQGMGTDFKNAWNGFWDTYKRNAETAYTTVWNWLKTGWNTYWTEYKQNAHTAYSWVWGKIEEGWRIAFQAVDTLTGGALTDLATKFNELKDNALQWFIDKINDVRQSLFDLRDNLKAIGDWISYLWGLIVGFVQNPLQSLASMWDWLAGLFGYSGGGAQGTSTGGISGSAQGTSIIPSSYTTTSNVSTVSNTGGSSTINLTVGDINNGMDLNNLVTLIKQVTGGAMVYG